VSLSGRIDDLPLLEILQVVAFCQKTGHLTVRTPQGDGAVVFRDGRVVSGFIWDVPPLGSEAAELAPEKRSELVRGRITSTLERLVRLREGHFGFNVSTSAPTRIGNRDLAPETLEDGINPEALMLDLARQMDEDRRRSTATLEASFTAPEGLEPPPQEEKLEELALVEEAEEASSPLVLLVDDEPDVRRAVGERLTASGFEVVTAVDAATGRREATRLAGAGRRFVLVADLGLPSLKGNTFRGGLDVVRHAASLRPRPRTLLMVDRANEALRARARRLGVSFLAFKPGLSKLDPLQYTADLRAFGDKLARDLLPRLVPRAASSAPPPAPVLSIADDLPREKALRSALEELARQPEPDTIAFLLLRVARSFLPRGVLLLVKDDRLYGLAGFGPAGNGQSLDVLARAVTVPLDEPSPFSDAVACGRFWAGSPPLEGPVGALLGRIGALSTAAAAVIPVRSQQETVAVLYGDAPDGGSLPDLSPLLDFAERAGRALDEVVLAGRTADTAA
jgi:CheY-like chemotaxis protein